MDTLVVRRERERERERRRSTTYLLGQSLYKMEELPAELRLEIFQFLDNETLRSVMMVCRICLFVSFSLCGFFF